MCEQASRLPGERAGEEAWGDTSTHQTEDAEDEEARIQHCEAPLLLRKLRKVEGRDGKQGRGEKNYIVQRNKDFI